MNKKNNIENKQNNELITKFKNLKQTLTNKVGLIVFFKWKQLSNYLNLLSEITDLDKEFLKYKEIIINEFETILVRHNFVYKFNEEIYLTEEKQHLLMFNMLFKDINNSFVKYFIKDIYPIEIIISPNAKELIDLEKKIEIKEDKEKQFLVKKDLIQYLNSF